MESRFHILFKCVVLLVHNYMI
ncbi:hypothetical protein COF74_27315 [Bacillus wiedmannii]|nr:hypothetical protein COF74_27315 [Bacillus wiedmannii]